MQSVCACASHLPLLQRAAAAVGWPSLFTASAWDILRPCSCTAAFSPAPAPAPLKSLVHAWKPCLELDPYRRYSLAFLFLPELGAYQSWGIRFVEQQEAGAGSGSPWPTPLPCLPAATTHLYGSRPIVLWPLGHTVSMDGLGERRPRGRVCVLGAAGEELIATLGTHVDTWGGREARAEMLAPAPQG